MRTSFRQFVTSIKSGIKSIQMFFSKHKKAIAKYIGKIAIFLAKTIIEMFLEDWF